MKLSTTQKVLAVVLGSAIAVAFVLTATAMPVGAAGYVFTRSLTVGSTGADVVALQQVLNASASTQVAATGAGSPGMESSYFGGLTKAALAKFQAGNGISPASGYFGPITREFLNNLSTTPVTTTYPAGCTSASGFSSVTGIACVAVTSGPCSNGAAFNSVTGASCSNPLPAGCTTTAGFSPTTGASCSTGTVSTNNGNREGSIALQSAPVSLLTSVASGDAQDAIMAFGVKATGSNVVINRVNVSLHSSTTALPWSYFSTLYLYSGSTLVGSIPVNSNTLTQNTFGSDYTASFGGINVNVPVDTTGSFTVKADIVNTIPGSPATYTIGLNDQSTNDVIRGTDGLGLSQYIPSGSGYNQTISFSNTGNGNVTITTDNANPIGNNVVENSNQTATGVTALVFDIKNTTNSAVTVQSITATINNVPSVSAYYLYNGLNQIQSLGNPNPGVSSGTTTLAFNNFTPFTVPANTTATMLVKFDASANANGTVNVSIPTASSQVAVTNNSNLVTPTGSATGNNFVLQGTAGVSVSLVGSPSFTSYPATVSGTTGYTTGTFQFQVSPVGVSLADLSKIGAVALIGTSTLTNPSTGAVISSSSITTGIVTPVLTNGISDGNTAVITVVVNRTDTGAGNLTFAITGLTLAESNWTSGSLSVGSNAVSVTAGLSTASVTGYTNQ